MLSDLAPAAAKQVANARSPTGRTCPRILIHLEGRFPRGSYMPSSHDKTAAQGAAPEPSTRRFPFSRAPLSQSSTRRRPFSSAPLRRGLQVLGNDNLPLDGPNVQWVRMQHMLIRGVIRGQESGDGAFLSIDTCGAHVRPDSRTKVAAAYLNVPRQWKAPDLLRTRRHVCRGRGKRSRFVFKTGVGWASLMFLGLRQLRVWSVGFAGSNCKP